MATICGGRKRQHDPEFYQTALGIESRIPSEELLRLRMDAIGASFRNKLLAANINVLKANGANPTKLPYGHIPVDIDVTPCDNSKTKKEGVSRTYKGCDGYAPIMAYIGREGYLIDAELREGKQHSQKHGESEQFHSEIKHDMDMERFPSGKFETNELFLELGMIAYNILRMTVPAGITDRLRPGLHSTTIITADVFCARQKQLAMSFIRQTKQHL